MSIFDDLFGGGRQAAARAWEDRLREGMGRAEEAERGGEAAFGPYSQMSGDILNEYRQALEQGRDPSALLNQYMQHYQMSPAAKAQIAAGQKAANQAAAASGMLGSGAAMQHAASQAEALRGQDMQNYLNRLFGIRSQYLGGLGGLESQGFRSAEDIARMRERLGEEEMGAYGQMGRAGAMGAMGHAGALSGALGLGAGILGHFLGF